MGPRHSIEQSPRGLLVTAILLVLVQAGLGMGVNLFVMVPGAHPGAHPANYLSGSYRSVRWALTQSDAVLTVHAALGLALVLVAIAVAVRSWRLHNRWLAGWATLGGLMVIGAGFNGASFLDFNDNTSSLIMALLALGAVASYVLALDRAGSPARR